MSKNTSETTSRNLLVIKASAGSGKTYTLALKYIQYLLFTTSDGGKTLKPRRAAGDKRLLNAHRQMLAITFTNKATDEMKQRIVKELYCLSREGVESDYLETFMKRSGLDEGAVRELARQALNELLFDYSNFNVSTIDSFFQTILRNFARELDRDFNYDIQIDESYAVRVAVHNFLLALGREGMPSQVNDWVKEYQRHMIQRDEDKKKWKFFDEKNTLNDFAGVLSSEAFRSAMPAVRSYLGHVDENGDFQCDFSKIRQFKKVVRQAGESIDDLAMPLLQELHDTLDPHDGHLRYTLKNWYAKDNIEPLTDTLKDADEDKVASQFKTHYHPGNDVITHIVQLLKRYYSLDDAKEFFKRVEDNLGLLGMLAMIDLFIERFRHENNSILISDTNELISTVLKSGSDFVYERVGTTISHFMIDEFQDTSTKQYENFKALLEESLANNNFNMLIGDAKQSIYRFRNADPTVFREKVGMDFRDDITDGLSDEERPNPGEPTSTNYRSSRNIIEFNNNLFKYIQECFPDNPVVSDTFRDVKQAMSPRIDEKKVPGYVRVLTGKYKGLLDDPVIKGAVLPEDETGGDKDIDVLTALPGYLLRLHERFDWRRMGILTYTRNQGKQVVERILKYNQQSQGEAINIISGESLLLSNSPMIRRIIAMLRFIDITQFSAGEDDADDDVIVDDPTRKMLERMDRKRASDQRMYAGLSRFIADISANPDADAVATGRILAASMDAVNATATAGEADEDTFARMLAELLPPAGELTSLVSIVETIIAHFKRQAANQADVDRETAFLLAFQDTVLEFCSQRNGGSVREFLKFWDEKKDSLAVRSSNNGDAINIMTIHAAKGLEFECVIIPFANWEVDDNSQEKTLWIPDKAFVDVLQSLAPDVDGFTPDIVPPLVHVSKSNLYGIDRGGALHGAAHDFVADHYSEVLIDNLNKTYVAMTRPRSELHAFCRVTTETKNSNSKTIKLTSLLTRFAQEQMTPILDGAGEKTGWYEQGTISTREEIDSKRSEEEKTTIKKTFDSYTVNDIPLELRVRVDHASSSSIDAGLRLHSLLSRIGDCNDVDRVISQGIKHGVISNNAGDPCSIDSVMRHVVAPIKAADSRVAAWFDPANRIYSERTITSPAEEEKEQKEQKKPKKQKAGTQKKKTDPDGIENLRPDRIIRRPDGQILVIDYKSGQRKDKSYLDKLNQYMDKLRLIFPGAPIAGRIWYVTHDLILDENGSEL